MKYIYIFILFLILSSPFMYNLTNKILKNIVKICYRNNCPTFYGLIIHTFIFLLLIRFILQFNNLKEKLISEKMLKREELDKDDEDDIYHNHSVDKKDLETLHNEYKNLFEDATINPSLLQSIYFKKDDSNGFLNQANNNQVKNLKKIIDNPNFINLIEIYKSYPKRINKAIIEFNSFKFSEGI